MLRYAKYVYAVYKEKSFSKAAHALYISQPALSAMIHKAEEEIGMPLFDRATNPIQPTSVGIAYIKAAEETMNISRNLEQYMHDLASLRIGNLTLGGANFTASCVYPHIISSFSEQYPGISISLVESGSIHLQNMALTEEIDLIMDSCIFNDIQFQSYAIFQGHVLLAVPAAFPINDSLRDYQLTEDDIHHKRHLDESRPAISLDWFSEEPFLLLRKGNDMHDRALSLCKNYGFSPKIRMELDQLMTTYHMANRGIGVSFVTDVLINLSCVSSTAVYYRLNDREARRNVFIAHKKNRYVTNAMSAFIETARDVFQ